MNYSESLRKGIEKENLLRLLHGMGRGSPLSTSLRPKGVEGSHSQSLPAIVSIKAQEDQQEWCSAQPSSLHVRAAQRHITTTFPRITPTLTTECPIKASSVLSPLPPQYTIDVYFCGKLHGMTQLSLNSSVRLWSRFLRDKPIAKMSFSVGPFNFS